MQPASASKAVAAALPASRNNIARCQQSDAVEFAVQRADEDAPNSSSVSQGARDFIGSSPLP
jgi:hypothetical protein